MERITTPRVWQVGPIKLACAALRKKRRALVDMATGLGKTTTAAFIIKRLKPKRVLFVVHNNFILEKSMEEFKKVLPKKTKMAIYNGVKKKGAEEADIVFASWQTMCGKKELWARKHFDLVIVDEAHHAGAEEWRPVVRHFIAMRLGLTATPDRMDEIDIREEFGKEVVKLELEEAIARGWLPRIEYHVITDESLDEAELDEIVQEIKVQRRRFSMDEINKRLFIRKRDEEIAKIINGYNEKAVVFCASITHADRFVKHLQLGATFHSAKSHSQAASLDENLEVLKKLRSGLVRRVCAVNAFNEGVDVPDIGLVAFCRSTSSWTIFRQQLGRGLRPGKDKLIVLDFVSNLERIKMVMELMNKVADIHEKITTKAERDKENYRRDKFEVSGAKFSFTFEDKIIDFMAEMEKIRGMQFYGTWQECARSAKEHGITSCKTYVVDKLYQRDPRLPAHPSNHYADWPGWRIFFGKRTASPYETLAEVKRAITQRGWKSCPEYIKHYKDDPKLPNLASVSKYPGFKDWKDLFGKLDKYKTLKEASAATIALGINSDAEYNQRYKEDPRLSSVPYRYYSKDWVSWTHFFGR